ncbi:MAG TPA: serine hydrolase, partial [Thermomicrobiales bacterium]|nr:serine hydrolase [Thermomicrobiales bacterium]
MTQGKGGDRMRVPGHGGRRQTLTLAGAATSLLLLFGVFARWPEPSAAATAVDQPPAVSATFAPMTPPTLSAKAAFAIDATAMTPLFAVSPDVRLPPASLTKIATALVVLDHAQLDERVTIAQEDLVPPDQSQVGLVAGDELSVGDLLIGLLVPSGNDAGLALARYVGHKLDPAAADPSRAVAAFVDAMNQKAAALGATNTHFVNPSGIDAPNHFSSARDLAALTIAGLANPVFRQDISTAKAVLASRVRADGYPVATTDD